MAPLCDITLLMFPQDETGGRKWQQWQTDHGCQEDPLGCCFDNNEGLGHERWCCNGNGHQQMDCSLFFVFVVACQLSKASMHEEGEPVSFPFCASKIGSFDMIKDVASHFWPGQSFIWRMKYMNLTLFQNFVHFC